MPPSATTAGLILAAGAGTRFGDQPKLLAPLAGRPLLQHVVAAACAVGELEPVVVVLGASADEVGAAVDFGRARTVCCGEWRLGLSASLQRGLAALAGAQRVLVMLGDTPTINVDVIKRLMEAQAGARAAFDGRPGHPVMLGSAQLSRLGELHGDEGARALLSCGPLIECGDIGTGDDVDTPGDLTRLRSRIHPQPVDLSRPG